MSFGPMAFGAQQLGIPTGKKKSNKRGTRSPSKPGSSHLDALTAAHGAGKFNEAGNHALNYAKAVKKHVNAMNPAAVQSTAAGDADDVGGIAPDAGPVTSLTSSPAPSRPPFNRTALAALASRPRK